MTIQEIRKRLSEKVLRYRSIQRIVNSRKFEQVYDRLDPEQLNKVIEECDKKALSTLIRNAGYPSTEYSEMSIRALRDLGRRYQIYKYSLMNKAQLISELYKVKQHVCVQNGNQ